MTSDPGKCIQTQQRNNDGVPHIIHCDEQTNLKTLSCNTAQLSVLRQLKDEPKPGLKVQTIHREAESLSVPQANRTGSHRPWHHPPREEHFLPDILHSRRSHTHTLVRKWPLSTHTLTPGKITNTDADTQAKTRMQGNGQHEQRAAGVCANPNS